MLRLGEEYVQVSYISALNWQKKIVFMQILPEKYFFTKMVEKMVEKHCY